MQFSHVEVLLLYLHVRIEILYLILCWYYEYRLTQYERKLLRLRTRGALRPLPNTSSWCDAYLRNEVFHCVVPR